MKNNPIKKPFPASPRPESLTRTSEGIRLLTRIIIALVILFGTFQVSNAGEPWKNWINTPQTHSPLIGKIWSSRTNSFVTLGKLVIELTKADYILLGEVHDNGDHHTLQAWMLSQIARNSSPVVVMEMIRQDRKTILSDYLARPDANAIELGRILEWEKSGWPDWELYRPIAEAVFRYKLKLLPGDANKSDIRNIAKIGFEGLSKDAIKNLALDKQLSDKLNKALTEEIITAHCNVLPPAMISPMVQVQRFRDGSLASAMVDAGKQNETNVVLIAGNGHIRADRAVPWYVNRLDPDALIVNVMPLEVQPGNKLQDLIERNPDGGPVADYFWFTPKAERKDPCEKLRRRFKK